MMRYQTLSFLWTLCLFLIPGYALARDQDIPAECRASYEEIEALKPPDFTAYTVWDKIYGEKGMDQFADFLVLPDGAIIAAGSYTKDESDKTYRPLIVKFDPKGKTAWEVREDTPGFQSIDRIVALGKGFAVIGDVKDAKRQDGIYLSVFDEHGKKTLSKQILEPAGDLDAKAVVLTPDGQGFIVAAQYTPTKEGEAGQYGVIYRLTSSGEQVWRRAYTPGMQTMFNNLQSLGTGDYALTGDVRAEDGRQVGWLLRINGSGAIQWQRTYPRGLESSLFSVGIYDNKTMILSGRTRPMDGGRWAAWVMHVDTTGNVLWQRYYTNDYNMNARQVLTQPQDGRSTILLDAQAFTLKQQTHTRLLILSPRGYLMNAEDFSESMGGRGLTMRYGLNGERLVSGYTQTRLSEAETPEDIEESVFDGWMFGAISLEPYKDPCVPGRTPTKR